MPSLLLPRMNNGCVFTFCTMCANILLSSYNSHGLGPDRIMYMNQFLKRSDKVFIQEHWLLEGTIITLVRSVPGASICSRCIWNDETELTFGRPYGGVVLLWKTNIKCKPAPLSSRRMCAVTIFINGINILLFNCYMPCDTAGFMKRFHRHRLHVLCRIIRCISCFMKPAPGGRGLGRGFEKRGFRSR